ncbi:MAG: PUA domain-containing protein [Halobacteriota archaeon]
MENRAEKVRTLADYQFGTGAGKVLFSDSVKFIMSTRGRVRQILDDETRIATVKAGSGWLTISIEAARRLHSLFPYPQLRVVVLTDVSPFIQEGGNVFSKHVVEVDKGIRANDEVLVVDEQDNLLATGKAILCAREMLELNRGMAVDVRWGIMKKEKDEKYEEEPEEYEEEKEDIGN